jgi:hypothetical protein
VADGSEMLSHIVDAWFLTDLTKYAGIGYLRVPFRQLNIELKD